MAARRAASDEALLVPLEAAAHALDKGDGAAAIDALVAAWRMRRVGALADLVERLSKRLPVPPVSDATDGKVRMQCFAERAHPRRAADVGPLLDDYRAVFESALGHQSINRAKILKQLDPDPRIAAFAIWAIHVFGDIRHPAPQLQKLLSGLLKAHANDDKAREPDEALAARLVALQAKIDAATLSPIALATVAPDGDSVVGLLASVYADPANDDLRQIVGDRLVELGDPRGELIALQYRARAGTLDDEGKKRVESLLRKHLTAWLGPLGPFVVKNSASFERGFPSRITSTARRVFERKQVVLLPEWNTIEDITFNAVSFVTPGMRCLRVAREVHADGLADLLALESPPPLEQLSLALRAEEAEGEGWLSLLDRLPRLTRFELDVPPGAVPGDYTGRHYGALLARGFAHLPPACAQVGIRWSGWQIRDEASLNWLAPLLDALPATVERFALLVSYGNFPEPVMLWSRSGELVFDGSGLYVAGVQFAGPGGGALTPLVRVLRPRVERITLRLDRAMASYVAAIEEVLRREGGRPLEVIRPG